MSLDPARYETNAQEQKHNAQDRAHGREWLARCQRALRTGGRRGMRNARDRVACRGQPARAGFVRKMDAANEVLARLQQKPRDFVAELRRRRNAVPGRCRRKSPTATAGLPKLNALARLRLARRKTPDATRWRHDNRLAISWPHVRVFPGRATPSIGQVFAGDSSPRFHVHVRAFSAKNHLGPPHVPSRIQ